MSDKLREAAQRALYAMESSRVFVTSREQIKQPEGEDWYDNIINDLEAALAEPAIKESLTVAKQEPVGQMQESAYGRGQVLWFNKPADTSMLYAAPPRREWVGLTQTQVKLLREGVHEESIKTGDSIDWVFYTHINEALKEKNGG